jgi:hypothetical protein
MVMAISNDSTITVSPVYYTMLGVGFAINLRLKRESATKVAE